MIIISISKKFVCCKHTGVVTGRYPGIASGSLLVKPPFSIAESIQVLTYLQTTIKTYKVFEIEYNENESNEKNWTCPYCSEEVKIINKKARDQSDIELENLEKEYNSKILNRLIPFKKSIPYQLYESGYISIENYKFHKFFVLDYLRNQRHHWVESPKPFDPNGNLTLVPTIIHKAQNENKTE